jgi:hypothetical protein
MDRQQQCSLDIFSQFLIKKRTKNTQENDQELTSRNLENETFIGFLRVKKSDETLQAKTMIIN